MIVLKISEKGISTFSLFILIILFFAIVGGGYIIYLESNISKTATATSNNPTASTNNTVTNTNPSYSILKPAIVPSKTAECSQALTYSSDGNPSPIQCSNGDLNELAWNALAALEPIVMKLGYQPSTQQVISAICTDGNAANADSTPAIAAPIETSVYRIASLYYGWHFSINPQALLTRGGC